MKVSRKEVNKKKNGGLEVNIIDNWLEKHGDPVIERLVRKNIEISNKIAQLLEAKNMKPIDLANAMSKHRSEVSKWLSGQHTFTTKTITRIEHILGEDIIHIEPKINNVYFTAFIRIGQDMKAEEAEVFEDSLYQEVYTALPL